MNNVPMPLTGAECSLLQILRTKVLGLSAFADFGAGLPIMELHRLELRLLLTVIALLGSCFRTVNGTSKLIDDAATIVSDAAHVLTEWPANFYNLLEQLGQRTTRNSHDIRDQFAPLYNSFFKRKVEIEDIDFIRIAFLDFVSNHWHVRKVDSRILQRVRDQVSKRFVTRAELARLLAIDPRTLKRHSELGHLPIQDGPNSTLVIDSSQFRFSTGARRKILSMRRAAALIGVSVGVLRELKRTGDFEVRYQLIDQPGIHQRDVLSFIDKLIALAPCGQVQRESARLGEFLCRKSYSANEKANVIRALLAARITIWGCVGGSVRGLLVSPDDLRALVMRGRIAEFGRVMTCSKAANLLGCDLDAVRRLIDLRLLQARKTRRGWQISESSVDEFDRQFVRLSSVAKKLATSSRRLMAVCRRKELGILEVKLRRGGVQPFVQRATVDTVIKSAKA